MTNSTTNKFNSYKKIQTNIFCFRGVVEGIKIRSSFDKAH